MSIDIINGISASSVCISVVYFAARENHIALSMAVASMTLGVFIKYGESVYCGTCNSKQKKENSFSKGFVYGSMLGTIILIANFARNLRNTNLTLQNVAVSAVDLKNAFQNLRFSIPSLWASSINVDE